MNTRAPNKSFRPRKEDILRLRKRGFTYNKIAQVLGCSKGTISYHCGRNDAERKKLNARTNKKRTPLAMKVNGFKSRCTHAKWTTFRNKIKGFKTKRSAKDKGNGRQSKGGNSWRVHNLSSNFTAKDVINKIGEKPICFLTGREIDLNKSKEYSLDHIVPTILGGTNDLSNLGICCTEANHAKAGLLLDEFYMLCEEILAWRNKNDRRD